MALPLLGLHPGRRHRRCRWTGRISMPNASSICRTVSGPPTPRARLARRLPAPPPACRRKAWSSPASTASTRSASRCLQLWMRLLAAVPLSILWLPGGDDAAAANLIREAQRCGIDPARLVFAPKLPSRDDHLARLSPGRPVPRHRALQRPCHRQRRALGGRARDHQSGRKLRQPGGGEPAQGGGPCRNWSPTAWPIMRRWRCAWRAIRRGCSACARKLAANRLSQPLFDTARFCRHIEAAYRIMWERAERGEAPQSFAVASYG